MNVIFYNDDELLKYEQQEQWGKTIDYLNTLVDSNASNKTILYRFAAQNWYILTFWDCNIPKAELNRNLFEMGLKKAYMIAKERWWTDPDCLWLFGYFMFINPMDFPYISDDIRKVEEEGNNLIRLAYFNDSNNQLAEILYLADNGHKRKYLNAREKYKESISAYFPSKSAVEQYFLEVFVGEY